jgi:endo-1,4-beta-xylanase
MARYHALGLSTHITELDVRIPEPLTAEKLREQARLYGIVCRAALESTSTRDVMLWDFSDRYSWITRSDGFFPQHAAGTIMDDELRLYPSFQAIRNVLVEARRESRQ